MNISSREARLLFLINLCLGALLLYLWFCVLQKVDLGPDAGYYLSIAERLSEGSVLYRDAFSIYTPVSFYIFSAAERMTGTSAPWMFLGVVILFEIFSAGLVYLIAGAISSQRILRFFLALIVLFSFLIAEGTYLIIEPFVLFFLMSALYFCISAKQQVMPAVFCGLSLSGAVLAKQYGILGLPPLFFYFFIEKSTRDCRSRQILLTLFSFIFLCSAVLGFFILFAGVSPSNLLRQISGAGYQARTADFVLLSKERLFESMPFLVPVLAMFSLKSFRTDALHQTLAFWVLLFFLPLLVRPYAHYFILFIPSAFLLSFSVLAFSPPAETVRSVFVKTIQFFVIISYLAVPLFACRSVSGEKIPEKSAAAAEEAAVICRSLEPRSNPVMLANPLYYYLCKFLPPRGSPVGYGFLDNLSGAEIAVLIRSANAVVIDRNDKAYFGRIAGRLEANGTDLFALLQQNGFKTIPSNAPGIEIWKRESSNISYQTFSATPGT